MSRTPAVSVVIPTYNAGAFLAPAIASIFAQTFTDWELIVVDDASTDGSWDYLRRVDDPRVRVVRNERNMNQAASINRGVELARAPYVALQDVDDLSLPERLERQFTAIEADQRIDVLGTGQYVTDRDLHPVAVDYAVPDHASIVRRPTLRVRMAHHGAMGRTEWWKRWPYNPRYRLCQDVDLLLRAHQQTTFGNVPDPLYAYRFLGQTRTFKRCCRSSYYRAMALVSHGFRLGLPGWTLIALGLIVPRIALTGIKSLSGKGPGLLTLADATATPEEAAHLREALSRIDATEVPLKNDAQL